jgi:hypothetical protein
MVAPRSRDRRTPAGRSLLYFIARVRAMGIEASFRRFAEAGCQTQANHQGAPARRHGYEGHRGPVGPLAATGESDCACDAVSSRMVGAWRAFLFSSLVACSVLLASCLTSATQSPTPGAGLRETEKATKGASGFSSGVSAYGVKGDITVSTTWMTPLLALMFTKSGTTPMD